MTSEPKVPEAERLETAALMLRRAAEACRNRDDQVSMRPEWFGWVAPYLDRLAEELAPSSDEGQGPC